MVNTRKGFKLTPTDKDKRIEELEAQIEKMKSPLNCKHSKENGFCMKGNGSCICDKWELED